MKRKTLWFLLMLFIIREGVSSSTLIKDILPPSNAELIFVSLQIYYLPNCPYAKRIIPLVISWQENHGNPPIVWLSPTGQFPSPTLRIELEDYYENYIGEKAILIAIK